MPQNPIYQEQPQKLPGQAQTEKASQPPERETALSLAGITRKLLVHDPRFYILTIREAPSALRRLSRKRVGTIRG